MGHTNKEQAVWVYGVEQSKVAGLIYRHPVMGRAFGGENGDFATAVSLQTEAAQKVLTTRPDLAGVEVWLHDETKRRIADRKQRLCLIERRAEGGYTVE